MYMYMYMYTCSRVSEYIYYIAKSYTNAPPNYNLLVVIIKDWQLTRERSYIMQELRWKASASKDPYTSFLSAYMCLSN